MKLKLLLTSLIVVIATCGAFSAHTAFAADPSSILVDVSPPNPAPGENTTITLNSYANNLDSVLISWSISGKSVSSGIGKKSFSLNAPALGGQTDVLAKIFLPDGEIEKTIVIQGNSMVLLWQANDSYAPPFYKGKTLPTADTEVKVVAMPEIKNGSGIVNPTNMTYAWQKDYNNDADGSGYGKNFYIYTNDYLENSNNIGVTASTIDQNSSASGSIDIGMTTPKIDFYRKDTVLGVLWNRALPDPYTIQGSDIITAIPYFISPKQLQNPTLVWSWSINDSIINIASSRKNELPLQATGGVSGTSTIKLDITNQDKIFETASKEINVQF